MYCVVWVYGVCWPTRIGAIAAWAMKEWARGRKFSMELRSQHLTTRIITIIIRMHARYRAGPGKAVGS